MANDDRRITLEGLTRPEQVAGGGTAGGDDGQKSSLAGRIAAGVLILLLVVGAVALGVYLNDSNRQWEKAREGWKVETSHGPYLKVRRAFLKDVEADRLDEAYKATTASYRGTHGRAKFDETAARFREFRKRPGAHNEAGPNPRDPIVLPIQLGPPPAKDAKPTSISVSGFDYWKADDGSRLRVWISVQQPEDSFLFRHPPPIGVDSFNAEYVDAKGTSSPRRKGSNERARRRRPGRLTSRGGQRATSNEVTAMIGERCGRSFGCRKRRACYAGGVG
jgi:hypothetical protein